MKWLVPCLVLCLALLSGGSASAAPGSSRCLSSVTQAPVRLEGRLTVERHQHPNGQEMRPFVLVLPRPVCLTFETFADQPPSTVDSVSRVQIAGDFNVDAVRKAVGRQVAVTGQLFGEETAWHVTPVLILVATFELVSSASQSSAVEVVRGFYGALSRADGAGVQSYLVEKKRNRGGYTIDGISKYYADMSPRLEVTSLAPAGEDTVEVTYRYGTRKGLICTNKAQVTTVRDGDQRLVEAVRADKDSCRSP